MYRKPIKLILFVLGVSILVIFVLFIYPEWKWGGHVQPSLDQQYVPTAQALMENTPSVPNFLSLYPSPGSVIQSGEEIFIDVYSERLSVSSHDVFEWTRIYINNVRIAPFKDVGATFGGALMLRGQNAEPVFSLRPKLSSGLHLFEIRVGTSINALLNPAEAHSYTWAYQVK